MFYLINHSFYFVSVAGHASCTLPHHYHLTISSISSGKRSIAILTRSATAAAHARSSLTITCYVSTSRIATGCCTSGTAIKCSGATSTSSTRHCRTAAVASTSYPGCSVTATCASSTASSPGAYSIRCTITSCTSCTTVDEREACCSSSCTTRATGICI